MQTRRELLKVMGSTVAGASLVTGAAGVVATSSVRASVLRSFTSGGTAEAPWCLMDPIAKGTCVGKGWSVTNLSPVENGASVLSLSHATQGKASVHICARKGLNSGLAHSHLLDIVLMDGGNGDKRTQENLGRVIMGIAKRISKNELGSVDAATIDAMSRMLTHEERMALYGPENLT
jgi:hypothetical protein